MALGSFYNPEIIRKSKVFCCFQEVFKNNSDMKGVKVMSITFILSEPAFTCSKLTIETLEQGVKHVQRQQ